MTTRFAHHHYLADTTILLDSPWVLLVLMNNSRVKGALYQPLHESQGIYSLD